MLNPHRFFRGQEQSIAVDRRSELDALLGNLAQLTQRKHLETAGVGQYRAIPAHEPVQATMRSHHIQPRPQPQVKGIAQYHLRADIDQFLRRHGLHRAIGADRHEGGCLHLAMSQLQSAAAGSTIISKQIEFHGFTCLCKSMASP